MPHKTFRSLVEEVHCLSLGEAGMYWCSLLPHAPACVFVHYSSTKLCTETINVVLPGFNVFLALRMLSWQFERVWCLCC